MRTKTNLFESSLARNGFNVVELREFTFDVELPSGKRITLPRMGTKYTGAERKVDTCE